MRSSCQSVEYKQINNAVVTKEEINNLFNEAIECIEEHRLELYRIKHRPPPPSADKKAMLERLISIEEKLIDAQKTLQKKVVQDFLNKKITGKEAKSIAQSTNALIETLILPNKTASEMDKAINNFISVTSPVSKAYVALAAVVVLCTLALAILLPILPLIFVGKLSLGIASAIGLGVFGGGISLLFAANTIAENYSRYLERPRYFEQHTRIKEAISQLSSPCGFFAAGRTTSQKDGGCINNTEPFATNIRMPYKMHA